MSFSLTEKEDIAFLNSHFPGLWETREVNGNRGLVIKGYSLPSGYNEERVDLMILIPHNYPLAGLDTFYVKPDIERSDGLAIKAVATEIHLGESWQRWSRHYDWVPGEDNLVRHLRRVEIWLREEVQR